MKKQFTIFLILIFVLGLVPVNFSTAITQNQIDAEVQIVCTDGSDNWFSGSGTIIDPKGIILTNRHVVEGAYMNTCFIGFIESISQEPNFGTSGNYNLAEVKYQTASNDMDAAILYLDNPTNKIYPYINIWNSNSDALQFGDKIEAIGFPSIGGSTITYTSGDFSGFGSNSDGTQNYIKSTAQLEHGNSGGASYNSNSQFIGIPTMVVVGTLNSLSYILSVNSIKNWLSGILGNQYQEEIIKQTPTPVKPIVNLQNDITPPNFNEFEQMCINYFNNNHDQTGGGCFPANMGKISKYNHIRFRIPNNYIFQIDSSGLNKIYYYFDTIPHTQIDINAINYSISDDQVFITDIIDINKQGKYYLSFFGEDNNGNLSGPTVYEYIYEPEVFKSIDNLYFFRDDNLRSLIKSYDVAEINYDSNIKDWERPGPEFGPLQCKTRLNNLTIAWEYPETYNNYIVKHFNSWDPLIVISTEGGKINENKYTISNLKNGNKITWYSVEYVSKESHRIHENVYYEFYLKPYIASKDIEKKHKQIKIVYDPYLSSDLICENLTSDGYKVYSETNKRPSKIITEEEISEIVNRLKGRILLQVEKNGEAYYVYPKDSKRYYLGRPADAFSVMRKLGLGATHQFINNYTIYPDHVLGKILIDVEQNGEAYYIYPKDKKAYYLGRPADAFRIMRELGLGITNSDLNKIPEGSL